MQRQYLSDHVETKCPRRTVTCQYCCSLTEHQFIEGHHKTHCRKIPTPCPNDCGIGDMPREDVLEHRNTCPLEIIQCTNECGKKMARQQLGSHLENKCPRRSACCRYCNIEGEHQFISVGHIEKCQKYPLTCPNNCDIETVCRGDMDKHRKICPLETIDCEYCKVGCDAKVQRKDLEKHSDDNLKEHLLLTTKKLNSTEDELEQYKERVHTLEIAMQHIIKGTPMTQGLRNALWPSHLYLASSIATNTSDKHVTPVILKMSKYTNLKLQKKKWFSVPFYTHKNGYKMCMSVYSNGINKSEGTHMSVFLHMMKGPYDGWLSWPLVASFKIYLLNQIVDTGHYELEVLFNQKDIGDRVFSEARSKGTGKQLFISNEKLEKITYNCQFLKNDTVFLKVRMNMDSQEY